jgi:hypothetical protein
MGFIAVTLPILLYVAAKLLRGVGLQNSMSAYYYAGDGIVRDVFVGVLVAVGALLYLYKGFSDAENIALNLAGIFAVVVALFPTQWQCEPACTLLSVHGTAAILFFACIAYVCLLRAADTLILLRDDKQIAKYKRSYEALGILMIVSPLAAFVGSSVLRRSSALVFFIEAFAVWVFAAYWFAKSRELRQTSADNRVLEGRMKRVKIPRAGRADQAAIVPAD